MDFVLKLCSWYPSRVDAFNGDFVQRHARAIATKYKTVVLYARKDPAMKSLKPELVYQLSQGVHEYIYYYPQRQFLDTVWSQWYYIKILKLFTRHLLKEYGQPSIIHVSVLWKAARWALYLNKKYKWPFVITEHSTEYLPEGADNFRGKEKLRKSITKKAFQKSKLLLPVSKHLGQAMTDLFGRKDVIVIPNVVDTKLFYPIAKIETNQPFKLIHISTMGYQKNIEGIIRVVKRLTEADLNFELLMVGPAGTEVKTALSETDALQSKVHFTGNISYQLVAAHLQQSDGFFLFSRFENLPCVILESLCCGVPVVSTSVGGINTVIDEINGELIPSEDEEAFYNALVYMISSVKKYNRMEIALSAMKKFNYTEVAGQFETAYQKALE